MASTTRSTPAGLLSGARRLRERLAASIWPLPTAGIVLAVLLGLAIIEFDRLVDRTMSEALSAWLFSGGPDTARSVLSSVSGALVTATSLTFSLTVVALQLASSQASPRLLRLFASDPWVHWTLAIFLGTFAYALTVLRTIRNSDDSVSAFVPRIAVTLSFVLALVSVLMLALFLAHLARELRVETMLRNVHRETDRTMETVARLTNGFTSGTPVPRPGDARVVPADSSGFVTSIDRPRLIRAAARLDIVVAEEHGVGDSVIEGIPLLTWWPARSGAAGPDPDEVARMLRPALTTRYERTPTDDIGFGIRQLVDIASRALSPGVNDPTTAVHALSHLTGVLTRVVTLSEPPAALADEAGRTRLLPRLHNTERLLEDAVAEPRRYGASNSAVVRCLFELLRDVGWVTGPGPLRLAIRREADRLRVRALEADPDETEASAIEQHHAAVLAALDGKWRRPSG
ncbi:MAG: DUF2254 domain-containing protein [Actinomycetota bacterium]|nr:DUF2254 domain-containing protein [Actinomycetota bacterium]